ncbi:CheY-like protein [Durotheca rogersii]|uniref:CheY-like protein n=1 Tax=Durotheca rogersii TaxID=419775 RepID=UPI00221F7681|nr:CheY-like protein [Durotheca rogersii]KAI5867714.1 CheY-like protein [Durotheca rogersii]
MVTRKVWVKRPFASPTLITINEDDLVDDVRELILRKYANSLGRHYDAPDLTLRIYDREQQTTRILTPDEPMGRTLDAYYSGGQSVDDALLIDIPARRTPKASPNPRYYSEDRPQESATDYFPPYPPTSQHPSAASATAPNVTHQLHLPPSMTVLSGNQLPPLPSPGSSRRLVASRPKIQRMHTASPVSTVPNGHTSQSGGAPPTGMHNHPSARQPRSRTHSGASSDQSNHPPSTATQPVATPPVPERTSTPPPPRVSSPRPANRPKKKKPVEHPSLPPGMLNGGVPPINVLIVEDNIINLKLLEAFVKRLKVRWQTAMNGREAVNKWRAGGFHLVLMDIQLPVMSGLEATREIRRIEKVNSIGVFSSSASSPPDEIEAEPAEEDKLVNTEMFKSPVIIVALTASSLQSDRHEALAAGCNDFLTKPVNFVWLERKVMEWGCMQALIDFDGWRKWKDYSQKAEEDDAKKAAASKGSKFPKKNRLSMTTAAA